LYWYSVQGVSHWVWGEIVTFGGPLNKIILDEPFLEIPPTVKETLRVTSYGGSPPPKTGAV